MCATHDNRKYCDPLGIGAFGARTAQRYNRVFIARIFRLRTPNDVQLWSLSYSDRCISIRLKDNNSVFHRNHRGLHTQWFISHHIRALRHHSPDMRPTFMWQVIIVQHTYSQWTNNTQQSTHVRSTRSFCTHARKAHNTREHTHRTQQQQSHKTAAVCVWSGVSVVYSVTWRHTPANQWEAWLKWIRWCSRWLCTHAYSMFDTIPVEKVRMAWYRVYIGQWIGHKSLQNNHITFPIQQQSCSRHLPLKLFTRVPQLHWATETGRQWLERCARDSTTMATTTTSWSGDWCKRVDVLVRKGSRGRLDVRIRKHHRAGIIIASRKGSPQAQQSYNSNYRGIRQWYSDD